MARKTLKCPKCQRKFSMKAHLARHLTATHGRVRKKKVAKKATRRRTRRTRVRGKVGRPKGSKNRKSPGSKGSTAVLRTIQSYRSELLSQRDRIDAEISALEGAMRLVGG